MSSAAIGKDTVKYLYNGIDQRVVKTGPESLVQTGKHHFAYDESGHLIGEYFADGAALEETVYFGDQPVVVLKQKTSGSDAARETITEVNYVYADQINTPRVITRATDNKMVWRWDATDPFGLLQPIENPAALGKFTYNARFPGQLYDRETNLHYNYHRDYDPQTGRYVQSDPIGLGGEINTYAYVGGNPLGNVDPLGLWSFGFEVYAGMGGGITFGRDNDTGQPFVTFRGGYGAGGGFDLDPLGKRPGAHACGDGKGQDGGIGTGFYAKVSGRAGPIKGGLGANVGGQTSSTRSIGPDENYGSFAKPKASATNRGTGINATAAAGVEFTIFGKGQCGCEK